MSGNENETGTFDDWIGRTQSTADIVSPGLVARFRATFDGWLHEGEGVPLGLHWCLAPPAVPGVELGVDGHPDRGGFLPPIPLENRMWAGGSIRFHAPLHEGETVTRTSRIASITPKQGRSGPLVFVAVDHTCHAGDRLVIGERQDIVYRPARNRIPPPEPPRAAPPPTAATFTGDPVTLFRYSALTFNGHRIHYDHPYATGEEGYGGLVVHGPLQATLLLHAAARAGTQAMRFDYRGLAPLLSGEPVSVKREGGRAWLEKTDGTVTFEGRFGPLDPEEAPRHDA